MSTQVIAAHLNAYEVAKRVREAKHWMVRSGGNAVGPVSLELLERGVDAGKIPGDAEMCGSGRDDWRRISDVYSRAASAQAVVATAVVPAAVVAAPVVAAPVVAPVVQAPQPIVAPVQAPAFLTPIVPLPIPPAPPSVRYPEDPISIPRQSVMAALFG